MRGSDYNTIVLAILPLERDQIRDVFRSEADAALGKLIFALRPNVLFVVQDLLLGVSFKDVFSERDQASVFLERTCHVDVIVTSLVQNGEQLFCTVNLLQHSSYYDGSLAR